jgi:hypothetical protein
MDEDFVAGFPEITNMAYLASSGLCIAAIGCLSQQSTARVGNALGIVGVSGGIAATLGSITASPAVVAQILGEHQGAFCCEQPLRLCFELFRLPGSLIYPLVWRCFECFAPSVSCQRLP